MPRQKRKTPAAPGEHVPISIRFPAEVYNELSRLSDQEHRSLAAQVLHMIERQLQAAKHGDD